MGLMQNREKAGSTNRYYPQFPDKFKGKCGYSVCRSSWEVMVCKWLDTSPSILSWSSEDIAIKYQDPVNPIDSKGRPKFRTYYPDFLVETVKGEVFIIEVKPLKETVPPKLSNNKSRKTLLTEKRTWLVNQAKWRSATNYCAKRGWGFRIITEEQLFRKG